MQAVMSMGKSFLAVAAAMVVAGCTTIRNAREAQDELRDMGRDDCPSEPAGRIDLSHCWLSELVDFAMTNRPSVARNALELEDARLAMKQLNASAPLISETPWLSPKLTFNGSYDESSSGSPIGDLSLSTRGDPALSVGLSIPIYDFGRHDAKLRAQGEKILDAELQLIDTGYGVFYDVATTYFKLLEKCALLSVAYTNELEYAVHLEQAERRMEAGEVKKIDVLRARLDLAKAREGIVNAQAEVDTTGAEFQRALGVDASHGTRRDILDFPGDPLTFVMRGFPDTSYTAKEAFELARTNAPSMRVARARLRAASADVDYAVADLMPEISASVSLNWTDPLWYWHWGVSVAQSLFSGFSKTTAVERSVNAMQQCAADVETAELELSLNIEKAVSARDTAMKAQETAAESLKEATDNLELVRQEYLLGEASRVEFTDAVSDYVEAMGSRISAFYTKQRAESAIFSLVGVYPVYEEKKLTEETKVEENKL